MLRSLIAGQGGVLETALQVETADSLLLTGVRIGVPELPGVWMFDLNWVRLTEADDGSIDVELPEIIETRSSSQDGTGIFGVLSTSGQNGRFTADETGMNLSLSGALLQISDGLQDRRTGDVIHVQESSRNWSLTVDAPVVESNDLTASFTAQEHIITETAEGGTVFAQLGVHDGIEIGYQGQFRDIFNAFDDLSDIRNHSRWVNADSLKGVLQLTGGAQLAFDSGDVHLSVRSSAETFKVSLQLGGTATQVIAGGFVQDSFQFSELRSEMELGLVPIGDSIRVSLRIGLSDLEVNPELIAMFAASSAAVSDGDHPPGHFRFEGSLEVPVEHVAEAHLDQRRLVETPENFVVVINSLHLSLLGAEMIVSGEISGSVGDGLEPVPLPFGEIRGELKNVKAMIEYLNSLGAITNEGRLGMAIVLGIGRAKGDDHYSYEIQFAGDNGITVNGVTFLSGIR
ncbi:MAG: hypothetical protein OXF74_08155 [Rhodobacteraceae bacterium]|nr:hypothetical protein [Paracoccaceae bacterium]